MKEIIFLILCLFSNNILAQKPICKKFTEKNVESQYSYVYEYDRQGNIITLTTYNDTQKQVGLKRYLRSGDTIRPTNYDEQNNIFHNGIEHLFVLDTQGLVRKEIVISHRRAADGLLSDWLTDTTLFEYNHLKQCVAYKRATKSCSITSGKDTSCSLDSIAETRTYKKGDRDIDSWQRTNTILTNGVISSTNTVSGTLHYTYKLRPKLRFDPLACNQVKCNQNSYALLKVYDLDPKTNAKRLHFWYKPVFNQQKDVIQNTLYYYEDDARTQLKSNTFLYSYEFYP